MDTEELKTICNFITLSAPRCRDSPQLPAAWNANIKLALALHCREWFRRADMPKPRATTKRAQPSPRRAAPVVPARILAKLRAICLALPDAYEETAWTGIRWMVRKRNFAHVLRIDNSWPPAYARAAAHNGPLVVLTFRTSASLHDVLQDADPRFFVAEWGTRWGTKVVGLKLSGEVDWGEVKMLLESSHALLAASPTRARASQ
jgi:hypothetical protein